MKRKVKAFLIGFVFLLGIAIFLIIFNALTPISIVTPSQENEEFWWRGKITFISLRGEGMSIYIMNPDGTNQTRLIRGVVDAHHSWSNDGKIACSALTPILGGEHIFIADLTTNRIFKLTSINRWNEHPSWSPDGKKIVFASSNAAGSLPPDHSTYDIFVINVDGTNQTRLTTEGGFQPCWSPDGERIAYVKKEETTYSIWVMSKDGTNKTRIVDGIFPCWLSWREIVFSEGHTFSILGTVDIFTKTVTWLTEPVEIFVDGKSYYSQDRYPQVSPDGKSIVFASIRSGNWDIYIMDADGSNVTRLTDNPAHDQYPTWAPP